MRRTALLGAGLGAAIAALVGSGAAPADPALPPNSQMPFCTFLGAEGEDDAGGAAVGVDGSVWIAAHSTSRGLRGAARPEATDPEGDVVVLRLDPATHAVVASAWIGGEGVDYASAVAAAPDGGAFVLGYGNPAGFPGTTSWSSGAVSPWGGPFLARVRADGSGFEWAGMFDDSMFKYASALAVTPEGDVVVGGSTREGAKIARIAADGSRVVFAKPVARADSVDAVAAAPDGRLVVGGRTFGFALKGAVRLRPQEGNGYEGYVAELDAAGSVLRTALLGSTSVDSLAVSGDGVFVLGSISAPWLTNSQTPQADVPGGVLFLRLGPDWTVTAARPFGGSEGERFLSMAAAPDGKIWVCGETESADLALLRPVQPFRTWFYDAFIGAFDAQTLAPVFMSYLGGDRRDQPRDLAVGPDGAAWLVGTTDSKELPVEDADQSALAPVQPTERPGTDMFVARVAPPPTAPPPVGRVPFSAQALGPRSVRLRFGELPQGTQELVVFRRGGQGAFLRTAVVSAFDSEWTDATALPARTYVYAVQPANAGGGSSAASTDELRTPGSLNVGFSSATGTIDRSRGRTILHLRLKGQVVAAPAPGAVRVDPVATGIEWAFTTGPDEVLAALSIPADDPRWRRTRRGLRWTGPSGRVEFDPESGVFDVRFSVPFGRQWPNDRSAVRVVTGEEAGAHDVEWRRTGRLRIRAR